MSARQGLRADQAFQSRADHRIEQLRVPPQSIEAEQAVLGGLMLAPDAYDRIADQLVESDFYRRDHQLIFRAIRELAEKSRPYDAVTLGEWFESQGLAEQVAGGALPGRTGQHHAVGREHRRLRGNRARQGRAAAADRSRHRHRQRRLPARRPRQQRNPARSPNSRCSRSPRPARAGAAISCRCTKALIEAFDVLQTRYANGGSITGLPTGYTEFDEMTAGLQPTDLIILAARPAMGKTTLALNMAEYAAIKTKKAVAVFSMEMSSSQLAFRLISSNGRINATRLRTGQLEDEDWAASPARSDAARSRRSSSTTRRRCRPTSCARRRAGSSASTTSA